MKRFLPILAVVIWIIQIRCLRFKSPFEFTEVDPRAFTWTVDTLDYPGSGQTLMDDIWGSSPWNVYVAGHNMKKNGSVYHFNGKKWSPVPLANFGAFSLHEIWGISDSDIWAVGFFTDQIGWDSSGRAILKFRSFIIHYDGHGWDETIIQEGGILDSVWGSSPSDVWAGGINTLLHYDGTSWQNYPIYMPPQGIQFVSIAGFSQDDVYMTGWIKDVVDPVDSTSYYLYHYDGSSFNLIDSTYTTAGHNVPKFGKELEVIGNDLYSIEYFVFKKEGSDWVQLYHNAGLWKMGGSSSDNIFCVGWGGTIIHYNGRDWQQIVISDDFRHDLFNVWTDTNGRVAILLAHSSGDGFYSYKTFAVRGE